MELKRCNPYPNDYPRLMLRVPDNEIVLVSHILGSDTFQVTVLSTGQSYVSELEANAYQNLPIGYSVTLTN